MTARLPFPETIRRRLGAFDLGPRRRNSSPQNVVLMMATVAAGTDFSSTAIWSRWAAGIYMAIAHDGYSMFPCAPGSFPPGS